ncbi:MAG TPA: hypothetical protein VKT77_13855, partial [Chthonomonadaceae bacterium]|nr:hypothetical protein [Chthonomonadaceae bacterium]
AKRSPDSLWLMSMAMWTNFMRLLPEEGIAVRELTARACLPKGSAHPSLALMTRHRYAAVAPPVAANHRSAFRQDAIVRPTPAGRRAQEVWRPLAGEIEERWRARFGKAAMNRLREPLTIIASRLAGPLPDWLPVLGYDMFATVAAEEPGDDGPDAPCVGGQESGAAVERLEISALLSRVLLAFTLEFEQDSPVSLPICANVLRLLDDGPLPVRELPRLSGVSKEAIAMATGWLERKGFAVVAAAAGGRGKEILLTPLGMEARDAYLRRLQSTEAAWSERFGSGLLVPLRASLEALVGPPGGPSPLTAGLTPYPDGWRAKLRQPDCLPHYPMVLHRGGWPDGS